MPLNTKAKILADSIQEGVRLSTFEVECPHHVWVHLLTHKALSRNAQSSRAIPTKKLIERATYVPERWYIAGKGMSPEREADDDESQRLRILWDLALEDAVEWANPMHLMGGSKETINRILQPFITVKGVVSATGKAWEAIFSLRCTPETQWETRELFGEIRDLLGENTPEETVHHVPMVTEDEKDHLSRRELDMLSGARIARVSYDQHDGSRDIVKDYKLARRLIKDRHASPFEHQAHADRPLGIWPLSNFECPWFQHRKILGL